MKYSRFCSMYTVNKVMQVCLITALTVKRYKRNKRPMGHIAHLSSTGFMKILFEFYYTFHFLLPHLTLRSHDFNKLAYALCQKAFM
jgi:hypothetical protein